MASELIDSLDPAMVAYVETLKRGAIPLDPSNIGELRASAKALRAGWMRNGPEMHSVIDGTFEGLRYRVYRPMAAGRLPAVAFFHGGGWTILDIDTHDAIARSIAEASGAAVLSLEYPLAPEAPFPAGLDACARFAAFIVASPDALGLVPGALSLAGDSAGGNLAVAAAIKLRDGGGQLPRSLALIYGSYDLSRLDRDSHRRFGGGELPLSVERMSLFRNSYVPDAAERAHPLVSPLYADLHGLPPSFLAVASHDPLYDENFEFAARLGAAGCSVALKVYPGTIHGFVEAGAAIGFARAKEAIADTGRFLAATLA